MAAADSVRCGHQEHVTHNLHIADPSVDCIVRLTSTGPERPGGNRVKLTELVVMPW